MQCSDQAQPAIKPSSKPPPPTNDDSDLNAFEFHVHEFGELPSDGFAFWDSVADKLRPLLPRVDETTMLVAALIPLMNSIPSSISKLCRTMTLADMDDIIDHDDEDYLYAFVKFQSYLEDNPDIAASIAPHQPWRRNPVPVLSSDSNTFHTQLFKHLAWSANRLPRVMVVDLPNATLSSLKQVVDNSRAGAAPIHSHYKNLLQNDAGKKFPPKLTLDLQAIVAATLQNYGYNTEKTGVAMKNVSLFSFHHGRQSVHVDDDPKQITAEALSRDSRLRDKIFANVINFFSLVATTASGCTLSFWPEYTSGEGSVSSIMVHLRPGEMVIWRAEVPHGGTWARNRLTNMINPHDRVHSAIAQVEGRQLTFPIKNYYNDAKDQSFDCTHVYHDDHVALYGTQSSKKVNPGTTVVNEGED